MNGSPSCIPPTSLTSSRNWLPTNAKQSSRLSTKAWQPKLSKKSNPRFRRQSFESLDSERAADIVEEMQPDAAADLLAESARRTYRKNPRGDGAAEASEEVSELLEFKENSAAGRMNTEYLALPVAANCPRCNRSSAHASKAELKPLAPFIWWIHKEPRGSRAACETGACPACHSLSSLTQEPLISSHVGANDKEVAELFDKYNLLTLPVVDDRNRLTGVITSDDVISMLRDKL